MTVSDAYSFEARSIVNIKTFVKAIRFVILNFILAIVFLFLIIEEIDWIILSSNEADIDEVIDVTSWNLNNLF